jgi:PAS domain-containing protein
LAKKVAIYYLLIASLWILLSDAALEWLAPGLTDVFYISRIKGLFFVSFTAVLLYFLVRRENKKREQLESGYTELFENNPNPMWLSREADGRITAANKSACTLYGYSASDFKQLTNQSLHPEIPLLNGLFAQYHCHKKADGTELWVKYLASETIIANEKLRLHMVISADAAIKAEAERMEVQKRLNDLLESMDDFVFGIEQQGTFSFSNRAFETYLQTPQIIGKKATQILDGTGAKNWAQLLKDLKKQHRKSLEWFDEKRQTWLRITAYQTEKGLGIYASNINEQKEQEKQLQVQNKQLMEIAWTQSHELRAPLANIMGLLHLLKIDQVNAEIQRLYLEKLEEAARDLDKIIHEVVAKSAVPFAGRHLRKKL